MSKAKPIPIELTSWEIRSIINGEKTMLINLLNPSPAERLAKWTSLYAPYLRNSILYIREGWARISDWVDVDPEVGIPDGFLYQTDWEGEEDAPQWHPPKKMPWDAIRLVLRVTDVRFKRFKEITEEDAIEAGYGIRCSCANKSIAGGTLCCTDCMNTGWQIPPMAEFLEYWDAQVQPKTRNPLVYLTKFERMDSEKLFDYF